MTWEVWFDGEKVAEYGKLYLVRQFVNGFGQPCHVRRVARPQSGTESAGVTESVT